MRNLTVLVFLTGCGVSEERVCTAYLNGFESAHDNHDSIIIEGCEELPSPTSGQIDDCSCPTYEELSDVSREMAYKLGAIKYCIENTTCNNCESYYEEVRTRDEVDFDYGPEVRASWWSNGAHTTELYDDCGTDDSIPTE